MSRSAQDGLVKIAVMGAAGTGKSTFIHRLTNDPKFHNARNPASEASDIETAYYTDPKTKRSAMVIAIPGFDDSREDVTDVEILQKISEFLQPESGEMIKLSGIIYMHRISDRYPGRVAEQNIEILEALCGEKNLRNVRLVTTNWDLVIGNEGAEQEDILKQTIFQPLLKAGAQVRRHVNNTESARKLLSELIVLEQISTRFQDQIVDLIPLGHTDAGRIIGKDIGELKKKHEEDLAALKVEIEDAKQAHNEQMRAALDGELRVLQNKIMRAQDDQQLLQMTLQEARAQRRISGWLEMDRPAQALRAALNAERKSFEEKLARAKEECAEELQKRLADQAVKLKKEREDAIQARDEVLRAEFSAERKSLEERLIQEKDKSIEELTKTLTDKITFLRREREEAMEVLKTTIEEFRGKRQIDRESFGMLGAKFVEVATKTELDRSKIWEEVQRLWERVNQTLRA